MDTERSRHYIHYHSDEHYQPLKPLTPKEEAQANKILQKYRDIQGAGERQATGVASQALRTIKHILKKG